MAYDFRANQVRLNRIISSGSIPIYIYSSGSAADFQGNVNFPTSSIGSDVFLFVSGSSTARTLFGGDVVVSGSLHGRNGITGSISGTIAGEPFILAGPHVVTNYNSRGQWEITGSGGGGGTPGGSQGQIQFNNLGFFDGVPTLTYDGITLQATGSFSGSFFGDLVGTASYATAALTSAYAASALNATTALTASVATSASFAISSSYATDSLSSSFAQTASYSTTALTASYLSGSVFAYDGLSGSLHNTTNGDPFIVAGPNITASYNALGQWEITGAVGGGIPGGFDTYLQFNSGSQFSGSANLTYDYSSSQLVLTGALSASQLTGSTLRVGSIDLTPVTSTAQTDVTASIATFSPILQNKMPTKGIGKFDLSVIALADSSDDFASWRLGVTAVKTIANGYQVIGSVVEFEYNYTGSYAQTWNVNIDDNGDVGVTGSAGLGTVHWYAKLTNTMHLDNNGNIQ